jgi:uncharacterized protein
VKRKIRIGQVIFDVVTPKSRCLATQANPNSSERDLPILKTLLSTFKQKKPTFAIGMVKSGAGGQIHIGDKVCLLD